MLNIQDKIFFLQIVAESVIQAHLTCRTENKRNRWINAIAKATKTILEGDTTFLHWDSLECRLLFWSVDSNEIYDIGKNCQCPAFKRDVPLPCYHRAMYRLIKNYFEFQLKPGEIQKIDFVDPSGLDGDDLGCGGVGQPRCEVDVPIDFGEDDDWGGGGGRGGGYSETPFTEDPGDDHNTGNPGEGVGSPSKGEKEKSPPFNKLTPCDVMAKDSKFRKWAKELWKNSIKPPDGSYKRETGGLWGHIIDTGQNWEKYEPKVKATYDRKSTAKSLPEFNGWVRDKMADPNYKNVNWLYWVHTHPVGGSTKPSGVGGDLSVSNLWQLPALIIGKKGRFSIYDRKNKWVCDGSIGKVK